MRKRSTDILTVQETRYNKAEKTTEFGIKQTAPVHKKSCKYFSGGQMLIYKKEYIIRKDTDNSTDHINVFDLMHSEDQTLLKIISVYG